MAWEKKIHNFQVVNENEMTLKHVNVDRNIGCDNNRKKYEDDETKLIRKVEQYWERLWAAKMWWLALFMFIRTTPFVVGTGVSGTAALQPRLMMTAEQEESIWKKKQWPCYRISSLASEQLPILFWRKKWSCFLCLWARKLRMFIFMKVPFLKSRWSISFLGWKKGLMFATF